MTIYTPKASKEFFDQEYPDDFSLNQDGDTLTIKLTVDDAEWLADSLSQKDTFTQALWWYVAEMKKRASQVHD